jgi:hypothetical protein
MKIILSRKGFDSESGKVPSPILPDRRLISLPIPFAGEQTTFANVDVFGRSAAAILSELRPSGYKFKDEAAARAWAAVPAHLDPDLRAGAVPRPAGWRPLFGQDGAAQTHLANQRVGIGDLFLFYGWFKETTNYGGKLYRRRSGTASSLLKTSATSGHALNVTELIVLSQDEWISSAGRPRELTCPWRPDYSCPYSGDFAVFHWNCCLRHDIAYDPTAPDLHVIFGCLEVGEALGVGKHPAGKYPNLPEYARYHPHAITNYNHNNNTIYVARRGGAFTRFDERLQLTAPDAAGRTLWRLPAWFNPKEGRPPLTYHGDPARWTMGDGHVKLRSVDKGQEFVLDTDHYPEAQSWVEQILAIPSN